MNSDVNKINYEEQIVKTALDFFERTRKKVEFEEFSNDYIFIPSTFEKYLNISSLYDKLDSQQRKGILKFDLFGILHLSYQLARESGKINQALEEKKKINTFFNSLVNTIDNSNPVINITNIKSELKQLRENTQTPVSFKTQLDAVTNGSSLNYIAFIDKIISEIDVYITRLLDQIKFSDLLTEVIAATELANKVLTKDLQDYEDLWITARAEEQNKQEHFNYVDQLDVINQTLPPEFSQLTNIKQSITSNEIFEPSTLKVSPTQKEIIKKDIELMISFINGDTTILDPLLKGLSDFDEKNLESVANLFTLIRGNKDKVILRYLGNKFEIDTNQLQIDSASFRELVSFMNSFDPKDNNKYGKLLSILDKIFADLSTKTSKEYRFLRATLSDLKEAFMTLMVNLIDVLDNKTDPKGFFNLFIKLENLNLFLDLFYGNLDDIFDAIGTNTPNIVIDNAITSACSRIEDNAQAKIKILSDFINKGEEQYSEFRKNRNDKLNNIITRNYKLADSPIDHKGYLANIYSIILEEMPGEFSEQDIDNLYNLSILNQSQILDKFKSIYPRILSSHSNILKGFMASGMDSQKKILESQNITQNDLIKFSNIKSLVASFQFIGFYPIIEKGYSLSSKIKDEIFNSYLNGWE